MSTTSEIENAVEKLSRNDLTAFRDWFREFDAAAWDRQFDDGGNESLDFLPLLRRVLRFRESAEQLIDGDHRDGAIRRRDLA